MKQKNVLHLPIHNFQRFLGTTFCLLKNRNSTKYFDRRKSHSSCLEDIFFDLKCNQSFFIKNSQVFKTLTLYITPIQPVGRKMKLKLRGTSAGCILLNLPLKLKILLKKLKQSELKREAMKVLPTLVASLVASEDGNQGN